MLILNSFVLCLYQDHFFSFLVLWWGNNCLGLTSLCRVLEESPLWTDTADLPFGVVERFLFGTISKTVVTDTNRRVVSTDYLIFRAWLALIDFSIIARLIFGTVYRLASTIFFLKIFFGVTLLTFFAHRIKELSRFDGTCFADEPMIEYNLLSVARNTGNFVDI